MCVPWVYGAGQSARVGGGWRGLRLFCSEYSYQRLTLHLPVGALRETLSEKERGRNVEKEVERSGKRIDEGGAGECCDLTGLDCFLPLSSFLFI